MLLDFYRDKTLLLTGATGFLGKVLLERFCRTVKCKRIYLLIRPRHGKSVEARMHSDIFEKELFDGLKQKMPNFEDFVRSHITPISGNIVEDGLGISPEIAARLYEEVDIIMNVAASVDFVHGVQKAYESNVLGPLRVLQLSKKCRNLKALLHVSTAYVNCDRAGIIEEKVYPMAMEPEELSKMISSLPASKLADDPSLERAILGRHPNTYCFTKCLAEHLLCARNENTNLCLFRPTIIGCSSVSPIPGWTDSLNAAGIIFAMSGVRLLFPVPAAKHYIGDVVPVDHVADCIILAAMGTALEEPGVKKIVHCGTSHLNPSTWGQMLDIGAFYHSLHPYEARITDQMVTIANSYPEFKRNFWITRQLPGYLIRAVASILPIDGAKKIARKYSTAVEQATLVARLFGHFTYNEWIFETNCIPSYSSLLAPAEAHCLNIDITALNWQRYVPLFTYGIGRWILREKNGFVPEEKDVPLMNLILKTNTTGWGFGDLRFALFGSQNNRTPTLTQLILQDTRNSTRVREAVIEEKEFRRLNNRRVNLNTLDEEVEKDKENIILELKANFSELNIRFLAYGFNKIFKSLYDTIVVSDIHLLTLRKMIDDSKDPILLMPTHRSYMDFLIIAYMLYSYDTKLPLIAADQAFLQMAIAKYILRNAGAFPLLRNKQKDLSPLYKGIFKEYFKIAFKRHRFMEFFIEGARSRTGLILKPRFGLLSYALSQLFQSDWCSDIIMVPITLNYDRVWEAETFPAELLGEKKKEESLGRVLNGLRSCTTSFGSVYIKIGDPISARNFVETKLTAAHPFCRHLRRNENIPKIPPALDPSLKTQLVEGLGWKVAERLTDNLYVTVSVLVATVITMHRKGIRKEDLIKQVEWLKEEVVLRGGIMAPSSGGPTVISAVCETYLSNVISRRQDTFAPGGENSNLLILAYYRSQLLHLFFEEALLSVAMYSFEEKTVGVSREDLISRANFLRELIGPQIVLRAPLKHCSEVLEIMIDDRTFKLVNDRVVLDTLGERRMVLSCCLLWPFIDMYWVCAVAFFRLQDGQAVAESAIVAQIHSLAQTFFHDGAIVFYESCAIQPIREAVRVFASVGKLVVKKASGAEIGSNYFSLSKVYHSETELQSLIDEIGKYRKELLISKGALTRAEGSMRQRLLTHYPVFARL